MEVVPLKLDMQQFTAKAYFLKALAHPVRLCIVAGLLEKGECNVSEMQNCLGMPQSTVSQQLGILRSRNIIQGERRGLEVCYRVVSEEAKEIVAILFRNQQEKATKKGDEE